MKETNQQLIYAELVKLCTVIPTILTAIVIRADGSGLTFYSKSDSFDEKLLDVTCAIFISAGNRITHDLRVGRPNYSIAAGSSGLAIYIPLEPSDYELILIIPVDNSPDDLWPKLALHYKSLLKYL